MRALYWCGLVTVHPWRPLAPANAVARVLYRDKENPTFGMIAYRMADGTLMALGDDALWLWVPGDQFEFVKEELIAEAQR